MRRASSFLMIDLALLCLSAVAVGVRLWRKRAGSVPRSAAQIAAAARARGMTISPACEAGVAANLALLAEHATRLRG